MSLNMIPLDTCIIVEMKKVEEKTSGGIFLPETILDKAQLQIMEGTIIKVGDLAFGELKQLNASFPKIGDRVYFKKYSGILHFDKETNKEYRILQDEDIYSFEEKIEEDEDE